jgi:hypothetical protein
VAKAICSRIRRPFVFLSVLDRFHCWSNFCEEIDLQSDLELL